LGLSVRGMGGEHTPIGADGTVDISPSNRLFIRERDIVAKLYEGVKLLFVRPRDPQAGVDAYHRQHQREAAKNAIRSMAKRR